MTRIPHSTTAVDISHLNPGRLTRHAAWQFGSMSLQKVSGETSPEVTPPTCLPSGGESGTSGYFQICLKLLPGLSAVYSAASLRSLTGMHMQPRTDHPAVPSPPHEPLAPSLSLTLPTRHRTI